MGANNMINNIFRFKSYCFLFLWITIAINSDITAMPSTYNRESGAFSAIAKMQRAGVRAPSTTFLASNAEEEWLNLRCYLIMPGKASQSSSKHATAEKKPNSNRQPSLSYQVLRVLPPARNGTRIAYISTSNENFTQESVLVLAKQLKTRFIKYSIIKAILFDDRLLAKSYAWGKFDPEGIENEARGLYFLDRVSAKEYVQFSSRKGNSYNEISIEINEKK